MRSNPTDGPNRNRFGRDASVVLSGIVIMVLLAGCGGSAGADPELSLALRDGVIGQCGAEGYGPEMCGCVVDELELRIDGDDLERVAAQIAAPEQEPPPEASEILLRCSERLGDAAGIDPPTSVAPRTLPPPSTGSRYPSADAACADEVQRLLDSAGVDLTDEMFIGYPESVCGASTNPTWCVETALTTSAELAGDGVSRELFLNDFLATCVLGSTGSPDLPSYTPPDLNDYLPEPDLDQIERDLENLENCVEFGTSCY